MADLCKICDSKVNLLTRVKLKDGYMCLKCYKKSNLPLNCSCFSSGDIRERYQYLEQSKELTKNFSSTTKIGQYLFVDDSNQLFKLDKKGECYPFSDLVNFELNEDGETISKGGLGKAVAGGLLLGGVGAVVGGVTGKKKHKSLVNSMYIRISLKNRWVKSLKIDLINTQTKKSSKIYKLAKQSADEIISTLEMISSNNESNEEIAVTNTSSPADEILKYKELLDMGAITQEEFDKKKKDLLG
ncbi:hypothetical protein AN1V17_11450 [Vallitalea sediminicola]